MSSKADRARTAKPPPPPLGGAATMYERVADRLRSDIMSGKLAPNERLKAPALAAQLGVSPSPVREALQKLQAEGLVILKPNHGAVVRRLEEDEFMHAMHLRAAIESMQAGICAIIADVALIARIEAANERFEAALRNDDREKRIKANLLFHRLIVTCDGNQFAEEILERVYVVLAALRRQHPQGLDRLAKGAADHRELIAALYARNADLAEQVARRHVLETAKDVVSVMKTAGQADFGGSAEQSSRLKR